MVKNCRRFIHLLLLCAAVSLAQERIGFIIGANRGLASERQLQFAVSDAKRIREVMIELCRFQESRTYLLANPCIRDIEKTVDEIRGRIKEIKAAGGQVEFLFYYSGHGSADALHVNGEAFPHDSLLSALETVQADLAIAVVDACYSGSLMADKGIALASPLSLKLTDTLSARGTILLASSSAGQISHESTDLGGSVFTHNLLSALRGAADYDGSGTVSLSEAYGYARMQTSAITGSRTGTMQQPSYAWDVTGRDEICLSWLSRGKSLLVMHSGEPCPHFVIGEPAQTVVAQFTPGRHPVALALPSGRYRIQRVCVNALAYTEADLTWKSACTLSLGSLREFPRTAFTGKGPLERPTSIHLPLAGALILAGYPDASGFLAMPAVGYEIVSGNYVFTATVGYGRRRLDGRTLTIDRSTIHAGGSAGKTLFASRFFTLTLAAEAGVHFNSQRMIRPEEERLRGLGYPSIPEEKTAVPFAGLSGTLTSFAVHRMPVQLLLGANGYIADMRDGYRQFIRPFAGFRTGLDVSR